METEYKRDVAVEPQDSFDGTEQGMDAHASLFSDPIAVLRELIEAEPSIERRVVLRSALDKVIEDKMKREMLLSNLSRVIGNKELEIANMKFSQPK